MFGGGDPRPTQKLLVADGAARGDGSQCLFRGRAGALLAT
jgi:hypothetical protein